MALHDNNISDSITVERLRTRAVDRVFKTPLGRLVFLHYLLCLPASMAVFMLCVWILPGNTGFILGCYVAAIVLAGAILNGRRLYRRQYTRAIETELDIYNGILCMCGYSLAEVRGTNCPECGRERNQPQSALFHHRIVSHGIDLIEVSRIAGMIDRHNDHFLHRVFTDHEQEYSRKSKRCNEHLAARFAAKEAVMKALGTGWRNGIAWTDIEVVSLASGAPVIKLHGKAKQTADDLGIQEWLVSLTHTKENAMASVIALKQSVSTQSQSISPAARS